MNTEAKNKHSTSIVITIQQRVKPFESSDTEYTYICHR